MFTLLFNTHPVLTALWIGALLWCLIRLGLVVIGESESGQLIKRYGASMPAGRLVALNHEAGYQAKMLPPGWHFGIWAWQYKVVRVPLIIVPPGEIALVVASDGATIPSGRILGREVACDDFQDADAFLRRNGERGRQLAFLTAGKYRINPALFQVITAANAELFNMTSRQLRVTMVPPDKVGVVTVLDGQAIPAGDVAGPSVPGHDSFQSGQRFIDAGGSRGLQEDVLLSGSWNLNPWFVTVDFIAMLEIPIGWVGVVVSFVGREHLDLSGDEFTHGDLVARGHKGVWIEPLLAGKHPINTLVMHVELVPTTNIVLNWAVRSESHRYDERLSPVTVRSKDGFAFTLDVAQIIHIGMKNAPRVISRVGSMQKLVDDVLEPTVANYFRNSAQEFTVLDFLSARSERQRAAWSAIKGAIEAYDVECIDTLIGDIVPPAALMETQTQRKIAMELKCTYEAQRDAHVQRQQLEREAAVANMQSEVVRAEQEVRIAEGRARSRAEEARGEANATKLRAEGQAVSLRMTADAEADATRVRASAEAEATEKVGAAKAEAYRMGVDSLGNASYTAMQLAKLFAENRTQLVPHISAGGAAGGLVDVMIAKMVSGVDKETPKPPTTPPATKS